MSLRERVNKQKMKMTEARINKLVHDSLEIMIRKNRERTDAWKGSGLMGQFIEIYSMYIRLKVLIWDNPPEKNVDGVLNLVQYKLWCEDVRNALVDMRNFTVLAELCLEDDNIYGDSDLDKLRCQCCNCEIEVNKWKDTKITERIKSSDT